MNTHGIGLFIAAVLLDTLGTTLFKLGANRTSAPAVAVSVHALRALWRSLVQWEVALGLAVYVVEYVIWISYLSTTQLSLAFPMYSVTIVLVLMVSQWGLREQVSCKRWMGAALIISGVLLLGVSS